MYRLLITTVFSLFLSLAAAAAEPPKVIEMKVDGLVCAFCAQGISKKLGKMDATADVLVNLEKGFVAVALKPGQDLSDEALKQTITEAGYSLKSVERKTETLDEVRARLGGKS